MGNSNHKKLKDSEWQDKPNINPLCEYIYGKSLWELIYEVECTLRYQHRNVNIKITKELHPKTYRLIENAYNNQMAYAIIGCCWPKYSNTIPFDEALKHVMYLYVTTDYEKNIRNTLSAEYRDPIEENAKKINEVLNNKLDANSVSLVD